MSILPTEMLSKFKITKHQTPGLILIKQTSINWVTQLPKIHSWRTVLPEYIYIHEIWLKIYRFVSFLHKSKETICDVKGFKTGQLNTCVGSCLLML